MTPCAWHRDGYRVVHEKWDSLRSEPGLGEVAGQGVGAELWSSGEWSGGRSEEPGGEQSGKHSGLLGRLGFCWNSEPQGDCDLEL